MAFLDIFGGGSTQQTKPIIPGYAQDLLKAYSSEQLGAMQGLPDIATLASNVPGMNVPGLDPTQLAILSNFEQTAQANPDLNAARAQIAQLTGGDIGTSPATQAGMKAWEQLVKPQVESASALRGTAGGGQGLEALSQSATAAAVPLIEQEIRNRQAAVGQLTSIGSQQVQNEAAALQAAGLPREVALQVAEANFQQKQQQFATQLGLQTVPQSWIPATFGGQAERLPSWGNFAGGLAQGAEAGLAALMFM